MKKFTTTFFIFSMVFCWVQISNAQCVQCDTSSHATGENASVIGTGTLAAGKNSFAGGRDSQALGSRSFAFGENAVVSEYSAFCFAMGLDVTALGSSSVALGKHLMTGGTSSMVIGSGYSSSERLFNTEIYSLMIGFKSTRPTLFVGSSEYSPWSPENTGRIGIGDVTDPRAKLHIRSDDNYNDTASIYIQELNNDKDAWLWLGNKEFGMRRHNSVLEFLSTEIYQFDGLLGIGTDDPQAKVHVKEGDIFIEDIDHGIVMKSPNGSCWRGTLTDEGQLQFAQVDCNDLMVSTPESPGPAQSAGIRIYPNPTGNHVTVEIPVAQAGARLSIKSSAGSELATKTLHHTSNPINMSSYPAGVYVFYIYLGNELLEVKKVVKE